jgi:hypothetical protein
MTPLACCHASYTAFPQLLGLIRKQSILLIYIIQMDSMQWAINRTSLGVLAISITPSLQFDLLTRNTQQTSKKVTSEKLRSKRPSKSNS